MPSSQIRNFFENQTVFLTGGSGFLGKVLMEKLLRECHQLKKIYVMIRPKKNKTPQERFEELFNQACFDLLKSQNPKSLTKVCLMEGDCQQPFLGLTPSDLEVLRNETTCVIHAASNVKFDQSLKEAALNTQATRDLLELAKQMKNLKVFIYISTAYSNCLNSYIREEFYEPPMKPENLFSFVSCLQDDVLESVTPKLLGAWPNTYIYTKSISESLVRKYTNDLPIVIIRPAIVISTIKEPMPGWIDNFYGVVGIVAGAGMGIIRSLNAKHDAVAHMVPVDYVCNCILAAAWKMGNSKQPIIYNFVGNKENQLTWIEFMKKIEPCCWTTASDKIVYYYCFKLRENKIWHKICVFFLHTVVAYVVDGVLFCLGRPRIAVAGYQRLNKLLDLISYFSLRNWDFDDGNVRDLWRSMDDEDKRVFCFNMESADWDGICQNSVYGATKYLLKETPESYARGKRKLKIFFFVHYFLVGVFWFLVYKLLAFVYGLFL